MNRILLAVLAMLAGLSAQMAPANARAAGGRGCEFGEVAALAPVARPARVPLAVAEAATRDKAEAVIIPVPAPAAALALAAPVLPGIDRAHE